MKELEFVGPEAGRWLQQEMTLFGGIVDRVVPGCFPSFARVLHRIDPHGRAIRWSEICEMTGATAHPLMQWHLISAGWAGHSAEIHQGRSGGTDPSDGSLDPLSMVALYEILWLRRPTGTSSTPAGTGGVVCRGGCTHRIRSSRSTPFLRRRWASGRCWNFRGGIFQAG